MGFFTILCNPSLAYIDVRDLQSSQRNASVHSLVLAGNFLVQPIAAECWRGKVANFRGFLEKKQYLMNTLYRKQYFLKNSDRSTDLHIPIESILFYMQRTSTTNILLSSFPNSLPKPLFRSVTPVLDQRFYYFTLYVCICM